MPEDQLASLPPEIRTMVMAGATAMMAQGGGAPVPGGPGPGMMAPGGANPAMMNQMMNMNPMMDMGVGFVGMNGDMGPMMPDGVGVGNPGMGGGLSGGVGIGSGAAQQQGPPDMGMVVDGFVGGPGAQGQGMMGVGMGGGEFVGMQVRGSLAYPYRFC